MLVATGLCQPVFVLVVALLVPDDPWYQYHGVVERPERSLEYVRPGGDLNGDGYGGFLAHYSWSWGYVNPPVVEVVSGLGGEPLWRYQSESGWSVTLSGGQTDFGDLTGDGDNEIILGWEGVDSPSGRGRGKVEAKSPGGSQSFWARFADAGVYWFGFRLRCAGDLNGDGLEDVLVGALTFPGGTNRGQVTVLSGADGTTLYEYRGVQPGEGFGEHLAMGVGDVDADGYNDFLIGSYRRKPKGVPGATGLAWVYSGATGQVIWEIKPDPYDGIGWGGDGPGDLDRDGNDDFILLTDWAGVRAYAGRDMRALWTLPYPSGISPGAALDHVPDENGDGVPEILLSQPGQRHAPGVTTGSVFVLSGATGQILAESVSHDLSDPYFGGFVTSLGDVNGDRMADWAAGGWAAGRSPFRIFTRTSLRRIEVHPPDADLRIVAPSAPHRLYAVLFAFSGEVGVPLASRRIPLDPDPLFLWSMSHPLWGILDERGMDAFTVPAGLDRWGAASGGLSACAIVFDPEAPVGVRTITNRAVVKGQ
ncbi:MAG: integrin alpha [Planctomycetota bacterium]